MPRSKPVILYIVRHGQTDWNSKRKIQGHTDIPLNEVGEEQAKIAQKKLKHVQFDAVFASDLLRAQKTAQIITLEKKIALKTSTLLRERHFGGLEGKDVDELFRLEEELEKLAAKQRYVYKKDPQIESDKELIDRFLIFLQEIALTHAGKTVLIVSHGGLMRAMLLHAGYVDYTNIHNLWIKNTGYFVLKTDGIEFEVTDTDGIEDPRI